MLQPLQKMKFVYAFGVVFCINCYVSQEVKGISNWSSDKNFGECFKHYFLFRVVRIIISRRWVHERWFCGSLCKNVLQISAFDNIFHMHLGEIYLWGKLTFHSIVVQSQIKAVFHFRESITNYGLTVLI